jgi:8-oxo-dGTP pyrophosphatase MutT (NUDIX family)
MQIIGKDVVWEGNYLRAVILNCKENSGKLKKWEAVERVNCHGVVAVVPITKSGELLLIRQFRPIVNNFVIEFPAGINDRQERLIDVAKRELIEETGYTAEEFIFLTEGPISSGMSSEIMTVFLAKNTFSASSLLKNQFPPEESEDIEIIKTPIAGLDKTLNNYQKNGDYIDLKIYGLMELAKKYL